jgi:CarboxypepD_reg-like domain
LVQGEIVDSKTGLPLAYVNIGVINKGTGTVSSENGKYELQIRPGMEIDTVRISMIGYRTKMFTVKEFLSKKWNRIELEEESNQLTEVVVTTRGLRKKNLGNKTTSRFIGAAFGYDKLGAEMGIKINVNKRPTFVDAFNFNISYNRLSAKALFRLNIYELERGKPSRNIMTESVIIPVNAKQTGLISVDLKAYNIILKEDVIATLEWVKNEGENNKGEAIFFSLGVFNSGTFFKQASQAKFRKYSSMGVGMNFDVRY